MAAINFPNSPADNDTFFVNGIYYVYDASKDIWKVFETGSNFTLNDAQTLEGQAGSFYLNVENLTNKNNLAFLVTDVTQTFTSDINVSGNITAINLTPVNPLAISFGGTGTTDGVSTAGLVNNAVTDIKLRDSTALSVIGRSVNTTGDPADITADTDHHVLRRVGTSLGFGAVALNQAAAITGTLPVANGGTGSNSTTFVNLATNVTGTLPVANGGTGITSLGTGVATFLGTPSSANLASAVMDETGTGDLVFATSPTLVTPDLGTPASGQLSNCTVDGTTSVGFRSIPQNSKSAAYELVLEDSGKHIFHPAADNNARTFTIPPNSNVAYPIGTALTFINMANSITIAITTDTLTFSPAGTSGSRTLAANGSATCVKITDTQWLISGSGLT